MNISHAAYLALPQVGSGKLRRILTSPDHCQHGIVTASRETLRRGSLLHSAVLEPDKLAKAVVAPELSLRGAIAKQEFIDWAADLCDVDIYATSKNSAADIRAIVFLALEKAGMQVVTHDEHLLTADVVRSVAGNELATELLMAATDIEQSYTRGWAKCRPDILAPDCIAEFKTARSVAPRRFASQAEDLGYWFQFAHTEYVQERTVGRWAFIAVEPNPDREVDGHKLYPVAVFDCAPEVMDFAREQHAEAVALYEQCWRDNDWPGPQVPAEPLILQRPAWATGLDLDFEGVENE